MFERVQSRSWSKGRVAHVRDRAEINVKKNDERKEGLLWEEGRGVVSLCAGGVATALRWGGKRVAQGARGRAAPTAQRDPAQVRGMVLSDVNMLLEDGKGGEFF